MSNFYCSPCDAYRPEDCRHEGPEPRAMHLDSGREYLVRFECNRCEDYRWRAVNPGRNIKRALKRLDEGNEERARELLALALDDLSEFAQWARGSVKS